MEYTPAIVATAMLLYGLASRRLERSPITGPMLFTAVGLLIGPEVLDILDFGTDIDTIDLVLTVTLALVLFTDAGAINSSHWREDAALPCVRLGPRAGTGGPRARRGCDAAVRPGVGA